MATILLSAAGAAIGSSIGGSVLGLSAMAAGRFVGAAVGRSIDARLVSQSVMGQGSEVIETGRIERYRITGSGEGQPIGQVYGRMRIGAHVIWATEFEEHSKSKTQGSGKGTAPTAEAKVVQYSYSVSLALALCEGEITSVSRVWADGAEIPLSDLNMRVYTGSRDQLPDPKIEAVEGTGMAPAYRGTAYVVIEDLDLTRFGNRVPQLSFEVTRPDLRADDVPGLLSAVAMIPGTGEYALATEPVYWDYATASDALFGSTPGDAAAANVNSPSEEPDFNTSLRQLTEEVPACGSASLIVSWFGSDLRCGICEIMPKVEQTAFDAKMPWTVCGVTRDAALEVPKEEGRAVYGGTPTDQSVIQAIQRMTAQGLEVMYYPFILMEQMAGNALENPWTGEADQPALPWRGRITLSVAPGRSGTPDQTAAADAEVASFFGTAQASDFVIADGAVTYTGPVEWRYNRFVLHQAALCAAAGGVTAFCIGSEMRGLTQIRGAGGFPAVTALRALAAQCRAILGPGVKIGYAADWTEYFGYQPQDGSGDLYFHLDPLWSDAEIDFIGIDNYMPLSDWRGEPGEADAEWGSIYNLDYLRANIEGGEGYDWFYPTDEARAAQRRDPITDGAHNEPWVWRYKDFRNWWLNPHHERIAGVRQETPTDWLPQSKPIWFTELGCAAVDKGTNEPNKFVDPKSSESTLPRYSNGLRDETIQHQYLRAMLGYWSENANNPTSEVYGGPMLDMSRAFVWAWDARPFPWFPGNSDLWSDGPNYRAGHWLNGRVSGRTVASVVEEICARVGVTQVDTSELGGFVRGYTVPGVGSARQDLQPLMLAHGFDAIERDGALVFRMRDGSNPIEIDATQLAVSDDLDGDLLETRSGDAEMTGRVRLSYVEADSDYPVSAEEAVLPDDATHAVSETELPLLMTRAEARQTAERWLAEARIARDTMRFALPPSQLAVGAGDILRLPSKAGVVLARVDRVEVMDHQVIDAARIAPDVYLPSIFEADGVTLRPFSAAGPVTPLFLDLPLMRGTEVEHAPHLAVSANPWAGAVAVYDAAQDADYVLNSLIPARSVIGVTETTMTRARPGLMDTGAPLQVRLASGTLSSIGQEALLSGGNLMAIGDGSPGNWELFQFKDASLLSEGRWLLSNRLRGQVGSDGLMPDAWPVGSYVVLMNEAPQQIELAAALRRVSRHFRIGSARRPYDDPSYVHREEAFDGNGLRPYRPVHLKVVDTGGDLDLTWVRRTRIDGDGWEAYEVPLGEDSESYLVRVMQGETTIRENLVTQPGWTYTAAQQAADALGGYTLAVAQISARYGPGPFAKLEVGA